MKLTSPWAEKNVCMRALGLPTSIPDWPPSPKMVTNQLPLPWPLKAWVPLSCVPPMMSPSGFCTFSDRLWNWTVPRPLFSDVIVVGTFDNQLEQSIRSLPERPRDEHWLETFENEPFSLHRPPSFAMKTMFGLNGAAAIACWSGCRLTPCVSIVMSVKSTPAFSERWTARPFDRRGRPPPGSSPYCITPPM